ncbi:MAG: 50S ribosomal protein L17 [Candidatus Spechtbacterales bacterium]|nr:50S ribosomal protein L17 [Candidatus Spechtbacterales bacterium]
MRKRTKGRKLNRKRDQREALMQSLAEALVKYERIETTQARAKALRPYIEKWITKSRKGTMHTQRMLRRNFTEETTAKLLNEIGPRFKDRPGGYTRIVKRGRRAGDAAPRSIIEFVE